MEFVKLFSCCCKSDNPSTVTITINGTCCQKKSYVIIVENEEDREKLALILDALREQEQKTLK
jgi:hypothetical protein